MFESQPCPLGILHLGLGSFHRAHQAVYLDRLIDQGDRSWYLVSGNLRDDTPDVVAAMVRQSGQYTLETVSPGGEREYRRVRSIREVVPFDPDLTRLVQVGADSDTRIISFTVTESGYYLDSQDKLDRSQRDLQLDLEAGTHRTIYGALVLILGERMRRDAGPITLLSCDNLRSNGERFRAGLEEFVRHRGQAELLDWIADNTVCPNSMVDRITPRPHASVSDRVQRATGWRDGASLMSESFSQWVIQDCFIAGRPRWDAVGAELVTSVEAHEETKIRLLNATHSCLAWAGTLHRLTFIHESVARADIRQMAYNYVSHDAIPCLDRPGHPSPIDLPAYRDVVLDRFSNPFVLDTNQRVATDGYSKMPGFIMPTLRDCVAHGRPFDSTALVLALFFEFLGRWHLGLLPYAYQDAAMDADAVHAMFDSTDPLRAFCQDAQLWGDLAGDEQVLQAMRAAQATVREFASRSLL